MSSKSAQTNVKRKTPNNLQYLSDRSLVTRILYREQSYPVDVSETNGKTVLSRSGDSVGIDRSLIPAPTAEVLARYSRNIAYNPTRLKFYLNDMVILLREWALLDVAGEDKTEVILAIEQLRGPVFASLDVDDALRHELPPISFDQCREAYRFFYVKLTRVAENHFNMRQPIYQFPELQAKADEKMEDKISGYSKPLSMRKWAMIFELSKDRMRSLREEGKYHFRQISSRKWALPRDEIPAEHLEKFRNPIPNTSKNIKKTIKP
jgi:hypothetical protein